jgi:hypothetical protein
MPIDTQLGCARRKEPAGGPPQQDQRTGGENVVPALRDSLHCLPWLPGARPGDALKPRITSTYRPANLQKRVKLDVNSGQNRADDS